MQVAGEVGGTLWMQLYMWAERRLSHQVVRRASAAGFEALLVTVDGVVAGNREYNRRNGFSVPFKYNSRNATDVLTHPRWMFGVLGRYIANGGMPTRANFPDELKSKITTAYGGNKETRSDSLNWDDLKALRDIWPGKLLVKGLLHPDDASKSLEYGADGIIVSNHGGRNCDAAPSPIFRRRRRANSSTTSRRTPARSTGVNSTPHVSMAIFTAATGVKLTHVPYKGGAPALIDIVSGQVAGMHTSVATAEAQIRSNRVRVIAVAGPKRLPSIPDVPTLAEAGIDNAEAPNFYSMAAPARTPPAIVQKLNAGVNEALAQPEVRRRLGDLGLDIVGGSPEDATKYVMTQVARVRGLIKAGVLTPE